MDPSPTSSIPSSHQQAPLPMKRARWDENFAKLALAHAGGTEAEVLDFPCGSGQFYEIFRRAKGLRLVDRTPDRISALLASHPDAERWNPALGELTHLPLADNSVDLAFCLREFHHLPDSASRREALAELARVSRKIVAISIKNTATLKYLWQRLRSEAPPQGAVSIATIVKEAARVDLRLLIKHPTLSYLEQQRSLIFEKTSSR